MQGWPAIRFLCNNQVGPGIIDGVETMVSESIEHSLNEGINALIGDALGLELRRVEMLPSGLEVVLAENSDDPQYQWFVSNGGLPVDVRIDPVSGETEFRIPAINEPLAPSFTRLPLVQIQNLCRPSPKELNFFGSAP